jgi:putative spermidine/putrescine transport system ATP-binding protein
LGGASMTFSDYAVRFQGVSRHFGTVRAVDDLNLDIHKGEFFAMLGPSGSGKTTCLRLIAGFEQPSAGHIEIFGERAEGIPPYARQVNTVFQDYALFPHMSVLDNVAYGMMVKGMDRTTRQRRAESALKLVALADYGQRRPAQLSGGQRQRVALARALVNEPKVLLLDEPLGALDLKLREQMQEELKTLQRQLGITFVFVTHDQGEALSMADRVAVFNEGKIVQVGTPEEIYEKPNSRFVANFVGSSNVLSPEDSQAMGGPAAWTSLRPERIRVLGKTLSSKGELLSVGTVTSINYQGASTRLHMALPNSTKLIATTPLRHFNSGDQVTLSWPLSAMHVLSDQA